MLIVKSKNQTKDWRKSQNWYTNGKSNECEKYQKKIIENITENKLENIKGIRLEKETGKMEKITIKDIKNRVDKLEYTEDFDGQQKIGETIFYYNLKMVCDSGGSQTRTLSLVYDFIKAQLRTLKQSDDKLFFVNILDGDCSYTFQKYFKYLLDKEKNKVVKEKIFVGDMYKFQKWFISVKRKLTI
jgi:hypothetical protein